MVYCLEKVKGSNWGEKIFSKLYPICFVTPTLLATPWLTGGINHSKTARIKMILLVHNCTDAKLHLKFRHIKNLFINLWVRKRVHCSIETKGNMKTVAFCPNVQQTDSYRNLFHQSTEWHMSLSRSVWVRVLRYGTFLLWWFEIKDFLHWC